MNDRICFYSQPFSSVQTYYDMIDVSAEYGMKYIEGFNMLDFAEPDIEAAKKIREYADEKGVKFICFSVYINLVGDDSDEQLEILKKYAEAASILGSTYFHHTIANEFSNPDNVLPYREEFFKKGINAVREIYDYCEKLGMKGIYEEQGYLFNGVEGYGRFLDEVDREVGVLVDFANICQWGDSLEDFIRTYGNRALHAHVKNVALNDEEGNTGLETLKGNYMHPIHVPDGDVDIAKGIELLEKSGFKGCYAFEYGVEENQKDLMEDAVKYVSECLEKSK